MKKTNLFVMALMGSLTFAACSSDDTQTEGSDENARQIITLAVANGNGISTRAGRPLLSAEANHTIENVIVYVVDASDNTIVATKTFNDWQNQSADYRTDDGRYVEFLLDNRLDDGNYKIFAVGYHNTSSYGDITSALVSAGKFQENALLSLDEDAGAEEIFAGATESFAVSKNVGFKQNIILNRQVAGVYLYVKDIPYIATATRLKLVASQENNQLVLGKFVNLDMTGNGSGNSITTAVVNGTSTEPAFDKVLATINLNDWFNALQDADGDNMIDKGDNYQNWKKPAAYTTGVTFQKGSVFGGEFIIPFAKVDGTQTLKLQLTTDDGTVKREWNINLPQADTYTLHTWNGADFGTGESVTEDINSYNIVRNHLYGLGTRETNDPGNGTDTEEETGTDSPVSLNNKHELMLTVNDNWEVIHHMQID